jgi:putative DNA primase/helicase
VRLPSEVLMRRPVEPHRAELMPLRGARLIVANEIEKGAEWNQSRLMAITSGDKITANAMRSNPVTFEIVGKLIVVGNNKPAFPNRNAAARDRLLLVHFKMHFQGKDEPNVSSLPPRRIAERDPALAVKLRKEWPAIMRWMVDGCIEWQAEGLRPPASVLTDSIDSISTDDFFLEWRRERCCDAKPYGRDTISLLHRSYCEWAEFNRLRPVTRREFGTMLDDHDIERHHTGRGDVPAGFELSAGERERISCQKEMR